MPGFLAIVFRSKKSFNFDYRLNYQCFNSLIIERKIIDNIFIERFTLDKFLNDKIFFEDENIFILLEGVVLNLKELINKYSAKNNFDLIKKMYKEYDAGFINNLKGEFSGFLYDKIKKNILIFTNQTSSKNLFYFYDNDF